MDVGIGLPAAIAGADLTALPAWAAAAEAAGFSSVAVLDRVAYGNADPLLALAAAATTTSRVRLTTSVLLAPLRGSGVLLAKQAATLDRISGGRLTLGLAVGGRQDDYDAAGADHHRRGRTLDRMLDEMRAAWTGEGDVAVGPPPARAGGPELLLGGNAPAALARAARHGDGWVAGGGPPALFQASVDKVRQAWSDAGRTDAPRLVALTYFGLGDDGAAARAYLGDYYAFLGPFAEKVAEGALTTPDAVRGTLDAFAAAGCDEVLCFPTSDDPRQIELLAEAAGLGGAR